MSASSAMHLEALSFLDHSHETPLPAAPPPGLKGDVVNTNFGDVRGMRTCCLQAASRKRFDWMGALSH